MDEQDGQDGDRMERGAALLQRIPFPTPRVETEKREAISIPTVTVTAIEDPPRPIWRDARRRVRQNSRCSRIRTSPPQPWLRMKDLARVAKRAYVGFSHHSRRQKPHAKTPRRKETHGIQPQHRPVFSISWRLGFLNPR
jgi:hypothetical protein